MATIPIAFRQLPNLRIGNDLLLSVSMMDGGVSLDWTAVEIQSIVMVADEQREAFSGACDFMISPSSATTLLVKWPAARQLFFGVHRLVIRYREGGSTKTSSSRVVNVVEMSNSSSSVQDALSSLRCSQLSSERYRELCQGV